MAGPGTSKVSVTKTLDGAMSGIRDLVDGVGYVAKTLEGMRVILCVCVCVCVCALCDRDRLCRFVCEKKD